ncbi:hypothetical protein [Vibrio phage vB_ValS_PJ32]|nr:hypothetical protein [Vibrio phage vB_ValS_PJ32]
MIGMPPPRPGSKRALAEQPKPKRTKPLVIKAKAKKVPKVKQAKASGGIKAANYDQPSKDLRLIAQYRFFGQWQVLNDKPTKQGYPCACVCGMTATRTEEQLRAIGFCNHKGSDQQFSKSRRAAQEFKQLVKVGLLPPRYINFNDFLKAWQEIPNGHCLITVAPGFMWTPENLITVAGQQKKSALKLQALIVANDLTALQVVRLVRLSLSNTLRYFRNNGADKTVEYLAKKLEGINNAQN